MTNPGSPAGGMRFDVLDALRGICALLVVLFHFSSNGYISSLPIVKNGWMFVDYFFVLSGFVIAHSYATRLGDGEVSVARFMGLRLGRIYPLHLFILLLLIALESLLILGGDTVSLFVSRSAFTGTGTIESLVQNLFLLQSFGFGIGRGWNVPAWSSAAEIWTYLLFAVGFVVARKWVVLVSCLLAGAAALALIVTKPDLLVTFEGGFIRCVFGFGLGMATYHAFCRFGLGAGGSAQELGALAIAIVFVSLATGVFTFLAPLVFAGMIFVLASQKGVVSRVLHGQVFQFLGVISYSIYMLHAFVQARLSELLQITNIVPITVYPEGTTNLQAAPLVSDAVTIVMLALVIAGSYVTYRLVEKPGQALSRRLLAARPLGAPAESAA